MPVDPRRAGSDTLCRSGTGGGCALHGLEPAAVLSPCDLLHDHGGDCEARIRRTSKLHKWASDQVDPACRGSAGVPPPWHSTAGPPPSKIAAAVGELSDRVAWGQAGACSLLQLRSIGPGGSVAGVTACRGRRQGSPKLRGVRGVANWPTNGSKMNIRSNTKVGGRAGGWRATS